MSTIVNFGPKLPFELFDGVATSLDTQELKSWSLVCRQFSSTAQANLFASVTLEDGDGDRDQSFPDLTPAGTTRAFRQLLQESPHIAKYVKSLMQNFQGAMEESASHEATFLIEASADILLLLSNLQSLKLNGESYILRFLTSSFGESAFDTRRVLEKTNRMVRNITLTETKRFASLAWIRYWSSVKEVTLLNTVLDIDDTESHPAFYDSLTSDNNRRPFLHYLAVEVGPRTHSPSKLVEFLTGSCSPFSLDTLAKLHVISSDVEGATMGPYTQLIEAARSIENLIFSPPVSLLFDLTTSPLNLSCTKNLRTILLSTIAISIDGHVAFQSLNAHVYRWLIESAKTITSLAIRRLMVMVLLSAPGDFSKVADVLRSSQQSWIELDEVLNQKKVQHFELIFTSPRASQIPAFAISEIREAVLNMMPCLSKRHAVTVSRLTDSEAAVRSMFVSESGQL